LKKRGHDVTAILTRSACELISPSTFTSLTGNRAFTPDAFDPDNGQTEHIALTDRADLVVVAPATANTIAKMAAGIADDMLTTTLLAVRSPVLVCPAMNTRMWNHPTVVRNLATLEAMGVHVQKPDSGALACGHVGPGRLAEPAAIEDEIERLLAHRDHPRSVPGKRFFLERQHLASPLPADVRAAEATYRERLVREGVLVASGLVGPGSGEALHMHRASSLDEARARAEASPLAKAGCVFDLEEWRLDGELGAAPARVTNPDAPTVHLHLPPEA
jgi:phosphopantothenoylcysteine decarboxylase/phosphopantothenate--cysteine ligase